MRRLATLCLTIAALAAPTACTTDADARTADAPRADSAAPVAATVAAPPAAGDFSVDDLDAAWRDQRGDTVRLADLAGPVRVVALVYTSCQATCPLIVADLRRVEGAIPAGREGDVRFVLVSIDPDRDTPGRLAEWAATMRLDPARWTLLNGDDGAVRELAATLGVRYQTLADGEVAHTNGITVLDGAGTIVHQQAGLGEPARETADVVLRLLR